MLIRNNDQETRNKQETNNNNQILKPKRFDLEERTTKFAKLVIRLCRSLPRDAVNLRLVTQIVGSAGSIGANYREANDALGKRDFALRVKTARKEAKETLHWLELIEEANPSVRHEIALLKSEAIELRNILSAIINKIQ